MATTLTTAGQGANLERGKYLVEQVARCQECHTPKNDTAEFDTSRWMKGATLVGVPSAPIADWHQKSPDIRSTSALWTRSGVIGQLRVRNFRARMHGRIRNGPEARWMPLRAEQYNVVDEPARLFYMNASMFMIPAQLASARPVGVSDRQVVKQCLAFCTVATLLQRTIPQKTTHRPGSARVRWPKGRSRQCRAQPLQTQGMRFPSRTRHVS